MSIFPAPLCEARGQHKFSLRQRAARLLAGEDVEKKSGVYPYVLNGDERHLNIQVFSPNVQRGCRPDNRRKSGK